MLKIWNNETIVNSLPTRRVKQAAKSLASTNLSACFETNIIHMFIKR